MTVFCPQQKCVVNCIGQATCAHASIISNSTVNTTIHCDHSSCSAIMIDGSNAGTISILSTNSALFNSVINATTAHLSIYCSQRHTCSYNSLYLSSDTDTSIECIGAYTCSALSIYSEVYIPDNRLNISINSCEECNDTAICIDYMQFICGNNYSIISEFDGDQCVDERCCDDDIFVLQNDYDQCVVVEWE
eukprot:340664_1